VIYALTVILPLLGNLAQLRYGVELGIKVEDVLAVEALAAFDEVHVVPVELSQFHDMFLGALELPCISTAPLCAFLSRDTQSYAPAERPC
jgi:hypothetical protein